MLKFGSREFVLVTRLNCDHEVPEIKKEDIKGDGYLKRVYFESLKIVTR